jgi:dynein intermediate chain 1, axonemal
MEAICFDLGAGVGDAAWSPHSSTTFAAVTDAGRVVVYDLAVSRDSPLCRQKVCAKAALTKLAFNPVHPVLIVGDDK